MRTLSLVSLLIVLAAPVPAGSTEATIYLAPRARAVVGRAGFDQAPSDFEPPVDWRPRAPGSEDTDYLDRRLQ